MKLFSTLLGILVLFAALAFALSNRQPAAVSLWPFGIEREAPVYLLTLGTLILGLLLGAVITWFSLLPDRMAARRLRKDVAKLQDKIDSLQQTVIPPHAKDDGATPRLPAPKTRWRFRRTES